MIGQGPSLQSIREENERAFWITVTEYTIAVILPIFTFISLYYSISGGPVAPLYVVIVLGVGFAVWNVVVRDRVFEVIIDDDESQDIDTQE